MSSEREIAGSTSDIDREMSCNGIVLHEFQDGSSAKMERDREAESIDHSVTTSNESILNKNHNTKRKICIIAKLRCVFFPMKLFGLFMENITCSSQQEDTTDRSRISFFAKRSYQCFVLLILWANVFKTIASFSSVPPGIVQLLVPMLLWYSQTALQGTICFFTMHLTSKKSSFKSLVMYWNSQPNFDELVAEPYMIKTVSRSLHAVYAVIVLNTVLYGLILFLPSESLKPVVEGIVSPWSDNIGTRVLTFLVSIYCSAAWLMPFAIFTAVCLTLIHQCRKLRKTLRLTASASEIRRIKILRQQHSSLCGSVRKVDNLFKFFTLVVYITNIPLVCFLLFDLIFMEFRGVTAKVTLSFWFITVAFIMVSVSFLGAHLNSKIHSFTEVVQKVQIANVDLDTHTELMLFIAKLNGDPVAITAGGLVPITKPLIVTVAGVVVTYFALLYELR